MATRTTTVLIDDIDGTAADHSIEIELDGEHYILDLTISHHHELVRDLARYMAVARRVGGDGAPTPFYTQTAVDPRAVREWARSRGIALPSGKRIPKDVIEQFRAAGN